LVGKQSILVFLTKESMSEQHIQLPRNHSDRVTGTSGLACSLSRLPHWQSVGGLLLGTLKVFGIWHALLAAALASTLCVAGPRLYGATPPSFDAVTLDWIQEWVPAALGRLLVFVYPMTGTRVTAIIVLALLAFFVVRRWWAELVCMAASTAGILLINNYWLKPMFSRSRPPDGLLFYSGSSFPSGHAAGAVVFYFIVCSLVAAHRPRIRLPLWTFAILWVSLIWVSALYCRAHWPTDIAAGAAVGYLWLRLCLAAFSLREQAPPGSNSRTGRDWDVMPSAGREGCAVHVKERGSLYRLEKQFGSHDILGKTFIGRTRLYQSESLNEAD
jgi:membrane-associated phospholipid phosphatase